MMNELPSLVPIFPVPGAVILPNAKLPVSINEDDYNYILGPAIKDYGFVGIIQPYFDKTWCIYQTGCLAKLEDIKEIEDDKFFALFSGVCRFDIEKEVESDYNYRLSFVNYDRFLTDLLKEQDFDKKHLLKALESYLECFNIGINPKDFKNATINKLITAIAMVCPLNAIERQALIETSSIDEQVNLMKTLIEFAKHDPNIKHNLH